MKISSVLKNAVAAAVVCGSLFVAACATTGKVSNESNEPQYFSFVKGKVWQLVKVVDPSGTVTFDSSKLDKTKFGDVYTMQFNDSIASGKAAPNRYSAPYALGEGNAISFKQAASTLMFGIFTPDGLSETEFFSLLTDVSRWDLKDNIFSLHTSNGNVLIFNEFDYR
ncbi:MAG: META domain-containing protein [Endomicrobia bacterium]|jgi:heat shock protein HslJ|nr:META domain-containing protein [Endomicrobiia bacterium]